MQKHFEKQRYLTEERQKSDFLLRGQEKKRRTLFFLEKALSNWRFSRDRGRCGEIPEEEYFLFPNTAAEGVWN